MDKQFGIQSSIRNKQCIAAYKVLYSTIQSVVRGFPFNQMFEHP